MLPESRKQDMIKIAKGASREDLEICFALAEMAKDEMRMAGIGWTGCDVLETARYAIRIIEALQDAERDRE